MATITFEPVRMSVDRAHRPNDRLQEAAGPFAAAIAAMWARPHTPYFEADEGRRHAIHIVLAFARPADLADLAGPLASWAAKRLVAERFPDAPAGLAGALKRLEGAWTAPDYGRLLAVLGEGGEGAKTLRHAERISPGMASTMVGLEPAFRRPRIVALLQRHGRAPQVVAEGVRRAVRQDAAKAFQLAERLDRAGTLDALAEMLIRALEKETPMKPPVPGCSWFRPLTSERELASVGVKFRNCLKYRAPYLRSGKGAYYEVIGDEPACVELLADTHSGVWRFGEMAGHANAPLSEDTMVRIRAYLAAHGAAQWDAGDGLVRVLAAIGEGR